MILIDIWGRDVPDDDREYFLHRAVVEFEAAQRATAPEVANTHKCLAKAYLTRVVELSPLGHWLQSADAEKAVAVPTSDEPAGSPAPERDPPTS